MQIVKRKRGARGTWSSTGSFRSSLRPRHVDKPAPCGAACPLGTDVRGALALVAQRDRLGLSEEQALDGAWRVLTRTNPFPAITGRICPHPCEGRCNRTEKDAAVAIAALERFVGDWGISRGLEHVREASGPSERKVAVVGAGPSGLSCAFVLARRGHQVTVFESLPRPGGMLRYGVPEHRLSRAVLDAEIGKLRRLDIELRCDERVGERVTLEELRASHDAVFVGIGAHQPRKLEISGDGPHVMPGIEFLQRASSASPPTFGPRVVVVGDGQTAIDAARVANRIGHATQREGFSVTLLRAHRPGEEGLEDLVQEGIRIMPGVMPTALLRDERGELCAVQAQPATLGPPDASGTCLPLPVAGEPACIPASFVIAAVSQVPDWGGLGLLDPGARGLEVDDWGRTRAERVWSGGDNVTLGVAAASIHQGMKAAASIDAFLRGTEPVAPLPQRQPVSTGRVKLAHYERRPRSSSHLLTVEERLHNLAAEADQGITLQQCVYEAARCLSCGACSGCGNCWMYCTPSCFTKQDPPRQGEPLYSVELALCDGCRKCADECPTGFIEMS